MLKLLSLYIVAWENCMSTKMMNLKDLLSASVVGLVDISFIHVAEKVSALNLSALALHSL